MLYRTSSSILLRFALASLLVSVCAAQQNRPAERGIERRATTDDASRPAPRESTSPQQALETATARKTPPETRGSSHPVSGLGQAPLDVGITIDLRRSAFGFATYCRARPPLGPAWSAATSS